MAFPRSLPEEALLTETRHSSLGTSSKFSKKRSICFELVNSPGLLQWHTHAVPVPGVVKLFSLCMLGVLGYTETARALGLLQQTAYHL